MIACYLHILFHLWLAEKWQKTDFVSTKLPENSISVLYFRKWAGPFCSCWGRHITLCNRPNLLKTHLCRQKWHFHTGNGFGLCQIENKICSTHNCNILGISWKLDFYIDFHANLVCCTVYYFKICRIEFNYRPNKLSGSMLEMCSNM